MHDPGERWTYGASTKVLGFLLAAASTGPARSAGSYSWAGIYNTEFWIDPQKEIGAVLLTQALPFYDEKAIEVLRGFEARVYGGLDGR